MYSKDKKKNTLLKEDWELDWMKSIQRKITLSLFILGTITIGLIFKTFRVRIEKGVFEAAVGA